MRFTSLIIELIRARPRWWSGLWCCCSGLFGGSCAALYRTLPAILPRAAFGREYQVAPISGRTGILARRYRVSRRRQYRFGVYLLAQICSIVPS